MKILRPLRTDCITQGFGPENTDPRMLPIYQSMGLVSHNGFDFACWRGEPIYHSADFAGIAKTETDIGGGIGVDVISNEPFEDGHHRKLRYWHLEKETIENGQKIKQGDLIGFGDSTGMSTGDHLHWGLKRCLKDGEAVDKDNGYYGAIDISHYFENKFVKIKKVNLLTWLYGIVRSRLIELKYG